MFLVPYTKKDQNFRKSSFYAHRAQGEYSNISGQFIFAPLESSLLRGEITIFSYTTGSLIVQFLIWLFHNLRYLFSATHSLGAYIEIYGHNSIFGLPLILIYTMSGGRTVEKLIKHDFQFVQRFQPHIIILEIGTNDLSMARPETVGSKIDDLVALLLTVPTVKVIGVCLVTFRASSPEFNEKVTLLNQYLKVVFEDVFNVFCWTHKGFTQPTISPLLKDGVHFTRRAEYTLYCSYRGAILKAIQILSTLS